MLVSHEVAEELDLELGGDLVLTTEDATLPVRVGAFAANGAPPLADVLVPTAVAAQLGGTALNLLVVSAADDLETLAADLAEATGGEVELLRPPAPDLTDELVAAAQHRGRATLGATSSRSPTPRGPTAASRSTATGSPATSSRVQIPGMGTTLVPPGRWSRSCTRPSRSCIEGGLYDHLDPAQFAGCFVARHIDWDPDKPLSMHAWGLAIDFNTRDNALGARPADGPARRRGLRAVGVRVGRPLEPAGRDALRARPHRPDGLSRDPDASRPAG